MERYISATRDESSRGSSILISVCLIVQGKGFLTNGNFHRTLFKNILLLLLFLLFSFHSPDSFPPRIHYFSCAIVSTEIIQVSHLVTRSLTWPLAPLKERRIIIIIIIIILLPNAECTRLRMAHRGDQTGHGTNERVSGLEVCSLNAFLPPRQE